MPISLPTVLTNMPPRDAVGSHFQTARLVTLDSSYVTGGEPCTAAQLGLSKVYNTSVDRIVTSTTTAAPVVQVRPLVQTDGSLLLKVMVCADGESDLVEAGSTLDLSGLSFVLTSTGI